MITSAKQLLIGVMTVLFLSSSLIADVKQDSETKIKIKGAIGSMLKLFGANKATRTVIYLKGDIQRTDTFDKKKKKVVSSQIVDLNREVFITLDRKKKKYTEVTFAEWREMLSSGLSGAMNQPENESQQKDKPETDIELSFTVDVETPGDTETMAGYKVEKVIVTLKLEGEGTVENEGQEPQKVKGGIIVRSTNWIAHSAEGNEEMRAFALKFAEKLGMAPGQGLTALIDNLMQSNEQLGTAIEKLQEESDKLSGVAMRTHTVFETWGEDITAKASEPKEDKVKMPSVSGLLKGFGKKKKSKEKDNVLFETKTKVIEYSTAPLSDELFVIPSKYKREKKKS